MKKTVKGGLLAAGLSLMLTVPAFADAASTTGGNGTMGTNTAGTGTYGSTNYTGTGMGTYNGPGMGPYAYAPGVNMSGQGAYGGVSSGYGTSGYSTLGTGRYGINNYTGYSTGTLNNGTRYRTTATTRRNYDWGWLGLLGLIGLAGMRSRNPERDRT